MIRIEVAALPLDFLVLTAPEGGKAELCTFADGEPRAGTPSGRIVLHGPVAPGLLAPWQAAGALCVPAARLLELIAPEVAEQAPRAALDLGSAIASAVRRLTPQSEVLRQAAEVLPESEAALRALVRRGLAQLAIAAVSRRPEPAPAARRMPSPFHDASFADLDPHAQLDRLFDHVHAHATAPGGVTFEPRPGQRDMAQGVLDAFLSRDTLVVEAGTGTGKTLAYVLPAVLLAAQHRGRFVFSTYTRTLQQQLAGRDLPAVWEALDLHRLPDGRRLRAAKLLGRENYFCRTALERWTLAAARRGRGFAAAQVWFATLRNPDGEIEDLAHRLDLDAEDLRAVCARREVCRGATCRERCAVHAARAAGREADLVVVNHALLCSDARTESALLGPRDGLVLDEAHHLEAVATASLAVRIDPRRGDVLETPNQGTVPVEPSMQIAAQLESVARRVAAARHGYQQMWAALAASLPAARRTRVRYHDADEVWGAIRAPLTEVHRELEAVAAEARAAAVVCAAEATSLELSTDLETLAAAAEELAASLEFLARGGRDDWVFTLEFVTASLAAVTATPLDVAVQECIGSAAAARIYTSATLRMGGDCAYFRRRVGIETSAPELVVPSPFDYPRQCLVVQADHLPGYADGAYESQVGAMLADIALRTHRRMLVLCTSHAAVRGLAAALRRAAGDVLPVLSQASSGGRDRLAVRFAATERAVLVGTSSFWEGVDFPGRALEILVIAKLPFHPPDDPLVEARCERLRAWGEDAFASYVLPEAVLRFQQGFGRLIRTRNDFGAVVLLDARLGERAYAAAFHAALPVVPEGFRDAEALVDRVVEWFEAPRATGVA